MVRDQKTVKNLFSCKGILQSGHILRFLAADERKHVQENWMA